MLFYLCILKKIGRNISTMNNATPTVQSKEIDHFLGVIDN